MCGFCQGHEEESGWNYAPIVRIEKKEWESKYYLIAIGESDTKFEINYCPKCGEHFK